MENTEQEKSALSSNGVRKLLADKGASLTNDERALLLALLSVDAETGGTLTGQDRTAMDELMTGLDEYDADELTQAVKQLVTAKSRPDRKLEWPELKRKPG